MKYLNCLRRFLGEDAFGHPKPDSRRLIMEFMKILKTRLSTINSAIEATIIKNTSSSANKEKDDVENMIKQKEDDIYQYKESRKELILSIKEKKEAIRRK